jgi:cell wall-associated NlpC family hydrolase
MSMQLRLDGRLTPILGGLAAVELEGVAAAERYAPVRRLVCTAPAAAVRKAPSDDGEQQDQLLFGEAFAVLAEQDGFAFGQALRDGYVGWTPSAALAGLDAGPTHHVRALRTYAFSRPDIKSPPVGLFSMNSLVVVEAAEERFLKGVGTGWLVADHLAAVGVFARDPAAVAEGFLAAPYQWGGRESLGLDCSGLVQQAFYACGRACPRDTDMQRAFFKTDADPAALRRGDLVFWRGHVAMMLDAERMIHANAHSMDVTTEPLAGAVERIKAAGSGEPTAFKRP